jgi:glycosyltransferase involved in cell wall biosynthesis
VERHRVGITAWPADDMKIAAYAITKDERHHIERFMAPIRNVADLVVVADTGSTDGTYEALMADDDIQAHRITISPWRFDDARNASLALVPGDVDVCICLDLDEVLQPGWREALEAAWVDGATRLRYPYVWSWQEDGSPGITYYADKVHARHGYRWRNPCHEVLRRQGQELQAWTEGFVVHHHPDPKKSRSSYLELMGQSLVEDPTDDRMQHYFARELMYRGHHQEAAKGFRVHLDNPKATWRHERSESMIYLARVEPNNARSWLYKAVAECPERKETWFALAQYEFMLGSNELALGFARTAQDLEPDKFYLSNPAAQGDGPGKLVSMIKERMEADREQVPV